MILRRTELGEKSYKRVNTRAGLAAHHPDLVEAFTGAIDGFSPPRAHPVPNADVGTQNHASNWSVGESANAQGAYCCTKADFGDRPRKVLG